MVILFGQCVLNSKYMYGTNTKSIATFVARTGVNKVSSLDQGPSKIFFFCRE